MIVRQVLPCEGMAIFLPDERTDRVAIRFAAGPNATALRGISRPNGSGIAGWVAVNGRAALNADAALDLGVRAGDLTPALRACLAVPLLEGESLVAVLSLYRERSGSFSEDDLRLLELLAPRLASTLIESAIGEEDTDVAAPSAPNLRLVARGAALSGSGLRA